jgi:hypothetical protein
MQKNKKKQIKNMTVINTNNCYICKRNDIITYNQNTCCHIFINDWIDITPEKSMYITYCIKCEQII